MTADTTPGYQFFPPSPCCHRACTLSPIEIGKRCSSLVHSKSEQRRTRMLSASTSLSPLSYATSYLALRPRPCTLTTVAGNQLLPLGTPPAIACRVCSLCFISTLSPGLKSPGSPSTPPRTCWHGADGCCWWRALPQSLTLVLIWAGSSMTCFINVCASFLILLLLSSSVTRVGKKCGCLRGEKIFCTLSFGSAAESSQCFVCSASAPSISRR
mmetsp:Transcript_44041/g.64624  ORF Transcript_44041/g.64624 Transcript_44041/m.64624 type:complete len:213 (-) Transcript_44041:26-664(-)